MNVFVAGSASPNIKQKYLQGIDKIADFLTSHKIGIVCVGTTAGTVGEMHKQITKNNGVVHTLIPKAYANEAPNTKNSSTQTIVNTLYDLQQIAISNTKATIVLPGGNGTLAELYMLTDGIKAKLHNDLIIVYNCNGFYDKVKELNNFLMDAGAMEQFQYNFFNFCDTPEDVITLLTKFLDL